MRSWYTFYFKQHFKVSFKFSSVFVTLFFSQFNGLFSSIKMNFCRDFQSLFTCMFDMFLSSKDIQSAMRQGSKHVYNNGDILLHINNYLSFTVRIVKNHSNSVFRNISGCLFHALQIFSNQCLPSYHITWYTQINCLQALFISNTSLLTHFAVNCTTT